MILYYKMSMYYLGLIKNYWHFYIIMIIYWHFDQMKGTHILDLKNH